MTGWGEYSKEQADADIAVHAANLAAHMDSWLRTLPTGQYSNLLQGSNTVAWGMAASYLYSWPIVIGRTMTFDRIAIYVQTAGAGGKVARLGIYNDGTNLYPGTLLLDAGTVAVDSTGVKAIVISQQLTKGIYHLALVGNGTPSSYRVNVNQSLYGVQGSDLSTIQNGYAVSQAYGALPSPFTAGGSLTWAVPQILLRLLSLD